MTLSHARIPSQPRAFIDSSNVTRYLNSNRVYLYVQANDALKKWKIIFRYFFHQSIRDVNFHIKSVQKVRH